MKLYSLLKKTGKTMLVFLSLVILSSTTSAAEITWTGCGISKKAFMAEVAKVYEAKTGIKIVLSGGGATKGIRAASAGTSDLGGNCRHELLDKSGKVHPEETDAVLIQVAWDALVAVAHPDNPVSDISLSNLKQVFDGKITTWKGLSSSAGKRIVLCTRQGKTSGVGYMFRLLAFSNSDYEFKARALTFKSSGPLEKKIEATASGLAISGISSAKKKKVKILSLDGVAPTKENIANGKYPLFRPLYISVNKNETADVKKFLAFILSPEGQAVISAQGTVNLAEGKALQTAWKDKKASFRS